MIHFRLIFKLINQKKFRKSCWKFIVPDMLFHVILSNFGVIYIKFNQNVLVGVEKFSCCARQISEIRFGDLGSRKVIINEIIATTSDESQLAR